MRKRITTAALAVALLLAPAAALAGTAEKANDVVLRDRHPNGAPADYVEVFKKEGTNGKNYLYTVTQVITSGGLYCTIVTFASETAGTATCLPREAVPNPGAFVVLDPGSHADGPPR